MRFYNIAGWIIGFILIFVIIGWLFTDEGKKALGVVAEIIGYFIAAIVLLGVVIRSFMN